MSTSGRNGSGVPGDAERDPRLDRLYRETAREEPPARVDAAILAAAHREVGARPRAVSARLRGWRVPVSIAAVVVLSVSLVTVMREEGGGQLEPPPSVDLYSTDSKTARVPQAAAPEAAKAPERALPAAPAARDDASPSSGAERAKAAAETALRAEKASAKAEEDGSRRAAEATAARSAAMEPQVPPRTGAPAPQPFQEAPVAGGQRPALSADQAADMGMARQPSGIRGSAAGSSATPVGPAGAPAPAERMVQRDRAAASEAAGSLSAVPPPAASTPAAAKPRMRAESQAPQAERKLADTARVAALVKEFESQPAEKWLDKIEALRREGRRGEADELLVEFKRRFPDHPLPPALR